MNNSAPQNSWQSENSIDWTDYPISSEFLCEISASLLGKERVEPRTWEAYPARCSSG
jgi:hypothetical protein